MEGVISVLQLPDADLQAGGQIRLVKIRVGNQGVDQVAGADGRFQRRLVFRQCRRRWRTKDEIAAVNVQYPVHPNEPLLQLTPRDLMRLRLNVRDFVTGYGRSHGIKKHHLVKFIKPHPSARASVPSASFLRTSKTHGSIYSIDRKSTRLNSSHLG